MSETPDHEQRVWEICKAYTAAKHPGIVLDTPHLLKRLIEEVGELAEAMALRETLPKLADEVGDVYNTLVMLSRAMGFPSVQRASEVKLEVLKDRTIKLRKGGSF